MGLNLHFLTISGTWEPNDAERAAAWELYVELVTRISVVLFLSEATVTGQVGLPGAHIGGQLDCDEATINNPGGQALELERVSVAQAVYMRPASLQGGINLTHARVGAWYDQASTWPAWPGRLFLEGFVYEAIEVRSVSPQDRVRWLRQGARPISDGSYQPQPYEQLAGVLPAGRR
ncbi:MAG: hypothetical protein ACXV3F_08230 [Frankiaceae bacterium]